jgi:hypothetical protein
MPSRRASVIETDLVKEHILAITALGRELLQVSILIDAMLQAQLLPELTSDYE